MDAAREICETILLLSETKIQHFSEGWMLFLLMSWVSAGLAVAEVTVNSIRFEVKMQVNTKEAWEFEVVVFFFFIM